MVVSSTGLTGSVTGLRSGRVARQNMAEKEGGRAGAWIGLGTGIEQRRASIKMQKWLWRGAYSLRGLSRYKGET